MSVAEDIDPAYAQAFREALAAGVEVLAYRAQTSLAGIKLGARVPVEVPR